MAERYELAKSIVIPKGTLVIAEPPMQTTYMTPQATIILGPTKDVVARWGMDLDEALAIGLVRKSKPRGQSVKPGPKLKH